MTTLGQTRLKTISGDFIIEPSGGTIIMPRLNLTLDISYTDISNQEHRVINIKQIKELIVNEGVGQGQNQDNFFFFFRSKPWSLVYIDGSYNYPITNYGNIFSYNLGTFNSSFIDNLSSSEKKLQLNWKIPPRIFIDTPLRFYDIYYFPIYNNLIIEFKEQNENSWSELLNINNFPDPSRNSGFSGYNNKNDKNMIFSFNLTRDTSRETDSNNIVIEDNSFNIIYTAGTTNFQNSKSYQFRIFLKNDSDLSNNIDYKPDQYQYSDISINYLYFPDNNGLYFSTAARGSPKAPTNLTFTNIDFFTTSIVGSLNNSTADTNNIISIPADLLNNNNNKLVFILSLLGNKNTDYKKFIPYSLNNYILNDISNLSNPSVNGEFTSNISNIEPEFTYDLSKYGMFFFDNSSNITYAIDITSNPDISNNFTTPHPLRNQVDSTFNNFIDNNSISLFNSDLTHYNSNLEYKTVKWRSTSTNKNFYFFTDLNSIFDINSSLNYKLFNSLKTLTIGNINSANEPRGIDLSDSSLCSFTLYSQQNKNGESNIYSPFLIDTSFNNFLTTSIKNNNDKYTFNYISQDISPNGANTINDYSNENGYYVGLILNDISYNIDLNDFFDETTDLCYNNVHLKIKVTQDFDNGSYNNQREYLIYKKTNDLIQDITLDSSSSNFEISYNITDEGTYFGLTSIKPHTSTIDVSFNGTLINLSKYIRSNTNNDKLSTINLKVSGSLAENNPTNINWEQSNNTTQNISHSFNYQPLSSLHGEYGFYEGNYTLNGVADLTIYNNVFSQSDTININNLSLGNTIDISNKYFWDKTNINLQSSNKIKNTNMIVFNSNPLTNFSHTGSSYNSNNYIKYNQAMFLNNEFYGDSNGIPYINYSNYYSNLNRDYSIISNSGDTLGTLTTITSSYSWNSYEINFSNISSKNIKWVCIKLDSFDITVRNNGLELQPVPNGNPSDIASYDIFYFIKTNLSNDWFNCQRKSNTSYASQTSGGIFHLGSNADGSIMKVVIPNIATINNLYILIGINETKKLELSEFDYNFW
mgnify:CR=1 FL=1